jgi:hypothetical protein
LQGAFVPSRDIAAPRGIAVSDASPALLHKRLVDHRTRQEK